jgi:hypothetical protein
MKRSITIVLASACLTSSLATAAEDLFAYPPQGRTEAQQKQDQYECHQWAVEQTKFDPVQYASQNTSAPAVSGAPSITPSQSSAQNRGALSAVGGAAQGAAIAEVAGGDAGNGAAAGAALGLFKQRRAMLEAEARRAQSQQQAQLQARAQQTQKSDELKAKQKDYQRARGACFRARGYTVSEG